MASRGHALGGGRRDGVRGPRRGRIELITPAPSQQEAAAIAAAIERFVADTAPPADAAGPAESAWRRAALREGVSARAELGRGWG
jgi:hypothetical protein